MFDDDIEPATREALREMWVHRLAGFGRGDLSAYLRDSVATTRYVIGRRTLSAQAFRRACRVLFVLRSAAALVGVRLTAEALDTRVRRDGERFVADATLVLTLAGRVFRQSRLSMTVVPAGGGWAWGEIVEARLRRYEWRYTNRRRSTGETDFIPIGV